MFSEGAHHVRNGGSYMLTTTPETLMRPELEPAMRTNPSCETDSMVFAPPRPFAFQFSSATDHRLH